MRDLNLLRSLRRLLEDEKRTAAALADGLKHADEYGLMDNPIVMDARVVLARMEAHNALDEAVLNRDRIRLDKALSEAREREVPASALDTAENILRLLVLAEDIADAVEGRDLRHLEKLTAEGTEAELEPALLQVAQERIVQLQAHEHLAGLIKDPSSTENALQQAMATAQACRPRGSLPTRRRKAPAKTRGLTRKGFEKGSKRGSNHFSNQALRFAADSRLVRG